MSAPPERTALSSNSNRLTARTTPQAKVGSASYFGEGREQSRYGDTKSEKRGTSTNKDRYSETGDDFRVIYITNKGSSLGVGADDLRSEEVNRWRYFLTKAVSSEACLDESREISSKDSCNVCGLQFWLLWQHQVSSSELLFLGIRRVRSLTGVSRLLRINIIYLVSR
jgi:hypothetical protein